MQLPVFRNSVQESMPDVLHDVLFEVSVRSVRDLWPQGGMSMLQQLEN